ncbi:hypothetical protein ACVBEQ_20130 [Nakamurella sp. GG22]
MISRLRSAARKYAGWLERTPIGSLWSRLLEIEFVDRSVALATKLFVSLFPLLIVAASVAPDGVRRQMMEAVAVRLGITGDALTLVRGAFSTPDAIRSATGLVGVLMALAYGVFFTTALQRAYLRAWRRPPGGGLGNKRRGMIWVAGVIALLYLLGAARTMIGGQAGTTVAWVLGMVLGILIWWWTAWLMLRGEVRWRPLLPTAVITGLSGALYAMCSDIWMPKTVTQNFVQFGAFGIALSLVTFFTGMAFIIVVGAVVGPVLAERDDSVGRWLRSGSGGTGSGSALVPGAPPPLPGPSTPVRLSDAFGLDRSGDDGAADQGEPAGSRSGDDRAPDREKPAGVQ